MSSRSFIRAVGSALGLVALGLGLFLLWPVQLGGWTAYAVIDGTSMEPRLHTGDLVVTRARDTYAVGDAVLYDSRLLDANVFHRVVAVERGRYVLRGDNRTQNDPEAVPASRIRGAEWVVIPGVGTALDWVRRPVQLAVLVFVLVLLVLAGGRELSRRRRPGDPLPVHAEPEPRSGSAATVQAARAVALAAAVALLLFGALSAVAWTRDAAVTRSVAGGYAHAGTFTYDAPARRGAAYPDGVVRTGEPVFTELSETVDVAFTYRFESRSASALRGSIALDLRLVDPATTWSRTLPLVEPEAFSGPSATVASTLDLPALQGVIRRVGTSTGTALSTATVSVVPRVVVRGSSGDAVIDDTFAPALPFVLDALVLKLAEPETQVPALDGKSAPAVSPLLPRTEGVGTVSDPVELALGPLGLRVERARSLGLVGLGISAVLLLAAGALVLRRLGGTERERIEARYGARIVAARAVVPDGRSITDLDSIDELMRVAEAYDRVVLRVEDGGGDAYLVDDGIAVYRYRQGATGALGAPRPSPAHGR